MSASGILNISSNQYQLGATSTYQQNLQQLSQALKSGNLSGAQSDFTTLQQAFSQPAATASSSSSNPVAQAFNQLASDLQSGNIPSAQKDSATLQQDLQSHDGPSKNHFHHHDGLKSGNEDSSSQNSLLQSLNQIGQNLASGNLAAAQQAYSALQTQPTLSFDGAPPSPIESPVSWLSLVA